MRKKRLVAAVLAGMMVFSSAAYADIQEKDAGESLQAVEEQTVQEQEAEVQEDSKNDETESEERKAEEKAEYKKKLNVQKATDSNASEDDSSDEKILNEEVTLEGQELENPVQAQASANYKIVLASDTFYKVYGASDPKLSTLYVDQFEFKGEDVPGNVRKLTNVTWEREPGENPGKYKITKFSCEEFPDVEVDEDSAWFTIKKNTYTSEAEDNYPMDIPNDGKEQTVNLFELFSWKGDLKPSKIVLKELPEADQEKFSKLPTVDASGVLHFTLKKTDQDVTVKIPFAAEGEYYIYPETTNVVVTARTPLSITLKRVEQHTAEEIKAFYKEHPFSINFTEAWTVTPDAKNGVAGALSDKTQENALNSLNFVRYIAGLNADVTIDSDYVEQAQAGTTLLTAVGKMEHTPKKPASVSQAFYELGYSGTSKSNLGTGYSNLAEAMIHGWMNDGTGDDVYIYCKNIETVGHRRWCLNPTMEATGFGHSGKYTSMYALDGDGSSADVSYVAWPAETMPIDYFYGPWSVSINAGELQVPDKKALKVTLTKQNGESVSLDSNCTNKNGKYLNYNGSGYGMGPAIIFEPTVRYAANDVVTVKIEGIQDIYGNDVPLEYTVNFFKMNSGSTSGGSSSSGGNSSSGGSSSGGGSHSSGGSSGGGGGSSSYKVTTTNTTGGPSNGSLPAYVVRGNWKQTGDKWSFKDNSGKDYKNQWAAVVNPYANTAAGQSAFDWFRFDEASQMMTGWVTDPDGNIYYCNPISDNTRGKMVTGWVWIPDANGVKRCYYFNPVSDGYRGRLVKNTVIEGSTVNADGVWTVNGVVQTK